MNSFAVISAVYNVARYLPDFFDSLDSQDYPHEMLHVVIVDDGSTDDSLELSQRWAERTDIRATVISQENAGQGAARNLGMKELSGDEWVTFTDPDDFVESDYFLRMHKFLEQNSKAVMLAMHHVDYFEDNPARKDGHALRYRFANGDRLVDLERYPRNFVMSIATSAVRADVLLARELTFDERVRPVLEDAHLIARYLLTFDKPLVGFVASAIYRYRRRGDRSSTMQTAKVDPRRYTSVIEYGTKGLLELARESKGYIPDWLQYETIYDLLWIYRAEDSLTGLSAGLSPATQERFHELVGECFRMLDPAILESYGDVRRTTAQREAMAYGYSQQQWRWEEIVVDEIDEEQGLVKLVYHFTGEQPFEEVFIGGRKASPRHAKTRDFVYFGRALIHERILWVSAHGTLRVKLNGESIGLTAKWPSAPLVDARPAQLRRMRSPLVKRAAVTGARRKPGRRRGKRGPMNAESLESVAHSSAARRIFSDAWVLMDRSHNANDNAEHLFKYLRKHRRDINAWFVVKKGTPDWRRLKAEGYKRIIPHGSFLWKVLCLNATHLISSHVDKYVVDPFPRTGGWKWKYVFLQHGVTKDDLSRWLNTKRIDGLVTATKPEYNSIVEDCSEYKFTTREVHLTGFPRHDRLARLSKAADRAAAKRRIVIMPTWRTYLSGKNLAGTGEREANFAFSQTEFVAKWREVLSDRRLGDCIRRSDAKVTFVPHPNLVQYVDSFHLPDWMEVATFETADVQKLIAEATLLVTDFSSIAFDAAFVGCPVVYYQFDRDEVFGGGHIGRVGYFNYAADGFGPVVESAGDVADLIVRAMASDYVEEGVYGRRRKQTFTVPRGGACKRVTEMIESLSIPLSKRDTMRAAQTPSAPVRRVLEA